MIKNVDLNTRKSKHACSKKGVHEWIVNFGMKRKLESFLFRLISPPTQPKLASKDGLSKKKLKLKQKTRKTKKQIKLEIKF